MGLLSRLLGRGLSMDRKAALTRAREQGFNTGRVLYHGSNDDIKAFESVATRRGGGEGISTTPHAKWAGDLAEQNAGEYDDIPRVIYPGYVRGAAATPEQYDAAIIAASRKGLDGYDAHAAAQADLRRRGFTHVQYSEANTPDAGSDEVFVFYPQDYRSVHAAFDPKRKHSADFLAAAPLAISGGLLSRQRQT